MARTAKPPKPTTVSITPKQRERLTKVYKAYAVSKAEAQTRLEALDDICVVLAEEGYNLRSNEKGELVLEKGKNANAQKANPTLDSGDAQSE